MCTGLNGGSAGGVRKFGGSVVVVMFFFVDPAAMPGGPLLAQRPIPRGGLKKRFFPN